MPGAYRVLSAIWFLLVLGIAAAPAAAQELPTKLEETTVKALNTLADDLQQLRTQRDAAKEDANMTRVKELNEQIQQRELQFGSLATQLNIEEFEDSNPGFDLESEVVSLVEPAIQWVKGLTEDSRQHAAITDRISELDSRQALVERARRFASRTLELLPENAAARAEMQREIDEWRALIETIRDERTVLTARLNALEAAQVPLLDSVRSFFAERGLTLLLCVVAFILVLFTMRWSQNKVLTRKRQDRAVSLRILEVVFSALGLVLAVAATLVVPWVRNDFVLLSLGIIFLIGAGWVLVKAAPQFFEQIRLILNVGSVREGERIIVDGLPYRVEQLRFHSRLRNPALQGGALRIPIQQLIGQRSRKPAPDEPWFPTEVGDVVQVGDSVIGKVITQTPEVVVVDDFRSPRTYKTTEFLEEEPRNLSHGFAITSTFGIDYMHQKDATTTIPQKLAEALRAGLLEMVPEEHLLRSQVQFSAAGSSSLDMAARADFAGEAAPRFRDLRRAVQRLLVDACTKNGWTIPFPQLTVHRAE